MINEKEIRDAVKRVKKMHIEKLEEVEVYASGTKNDADALRMLLDLAQAYLKAGKEMPEKIKDTWGDQKYERGYNQAIDDCTLSSMKREAEWGKKLDGLIQDLKIVDHHTISEEMWRIEKFREHLMGKGK